jgi:hypothetical protein
MYPCTIVVITGILLIIYFSNTRYMDMERYYLNVDHMKYKVLLYCKFVLLFACIYNAKHLFLNYLKK